MFRATIICDSCEQQYMLDMGMDIPPHWFGIQVVIADSEGIIPEGEHDVFMHFCSQKCLTEFAKGKTLKHRLAMIDQNSDGPETHDPEQTA